MKNTTPVRVGMVSLGCSKNQVDAERLLAILKKEGFTLCGSPGDCDVVVVNTCGFIEDAKNESIAHILNFGAQKNAGRLKVVAVTGCLAQRYLKEMAEEMPEVDVVLGLGKNAEIARAIRRALKGERVVEMGNSSQLLLEGERVSIDPFYTAYLKIAEGCDNRCSYCAIPLIRGDFRSREMTAILAEARQLADKGVTELNLVAQDTTRYGEDLYGRLMLPELLTRICRIEKLHWIRILYCHPYRVTDELLEVMAREEKVVPYMDIPVQHAQGRILKAMNRAGCTTASLTRLMRKIRAKLPEVCLRTTLITGFPGETEEDFDKLCTFVRKIRFERLGCFAFSREEGTSAYDLPHQVDEETRLLRANIVMEIQMDLAWKNAEQQIGRTLEVLCEGFDKERDLWFGRSYMDAPDIDTKVYFNASPPPQPGDYVQVRVQEAGDYDLLGRTVEP